LNFANLIEGSAAFDGRILLVGDAMVVFVGVGLGDGLL
jgi:hypothetical protein